MDELIFAAQRGRVTQDQYGEVKVTLIVPMTDAQKAMSIPIEVELSVAIVRVPSG